MRRLTGQTRKTVKLSDSVHRELAGYVLAAGAAGVSVMALASPSEGQIVYTPAHEQIERNGMMLIDLNHDGTTDLTIREIPWTAQGNGRYPGNSVQAVTRNGGGLRFGSEHYNMPKWAAALVRGSKIGPSNAFRTGAEIVLHCTSSGVFYGGFWSEDTVNRFLGIRFRIGEETHYGWARMNTKLGPPQKGIAATLTGYAYETQPGKPIRAGDTGGVDADGNEDSAPSSEIFSSPGTEDKATPVSLGTLALGALARTSGRRNVGDVR